MYKYNLGCCFEEVAEKHEKNIALKFAKSDTISYEELNQRSNQLGRYLLDIGVRRKDVVCISGNKQFNTYACMLACLKIGAVYTTLDPQSPTERLEKIFSTCKPKVLFVGPKLLKELDESSAIKIVCNEASELDKRLAHYRRSNIGITRDVTGTNPAYIMYTSGSTGIPKGAVMTHGNVLNFIDWSIKAFNITSNDVFTNVNPLYFDNSVFDFYSSLFSGASLVPFSKETVTNPKMLVTLIDELECTSWFSVPTLLIFLQTMKALNKTTMTSIRRYIFGGEGYPKSKLKKLYDTYSDRAEFFNVYGPTECTCICSSYKITAGDFEDLQGFPPLGKMIDNFSYLILTDDNRIVQDDQFGELCLLGPNVGKGYYNDTERTKISFVQNPYNSNYSEIMYKTGDLVKYNSQDGKIYVRGRKDNQIKHMGYRIELEEIETALCCLDYISQAAVLHGTFRGMSRIVAVVSSNDGLDETQIKNELRHILPDYMIPTTFHRVNELPKNSNGKMDRVTLAQTYLEQDPSTV